MTDAYTVLWPVDSFILPTRSIHYWIYDTSYLRIFHGLIELSRIWHVRIRTHVHMHIYTYMHTQRHTYRTRTNKHTHAKRNTRSCTHTMIWPNALQHTTWNTHSRTHTMTPEHINHSILYNVCRYLKKSKTQKATSNNKDPFSIRTTQIFPQHQTTQKIPTAQKNTKQHRNFEDNRHFQSLHTIQQHSKIFLPMIMTAFIT